MIERSPFFCRLSLGVCVKRFLLSGSLQTQVPQNGWPNVGYLLANCYPTLAHSKKYPPCRTIGQQRPTMVHLAARCLADQNLAQTRSKLERYVPTYHFPAVSQRYHSQPYHSPTVSTDCQQSVLLGKWPYLLIGTTFRPNLCRCILVDCMLNVKRLT